MHHSNLQKLIQQRFKELPESCASEIVPNQAEISERKRHIAVFSGRLTSLNNLRELTKNQKILALEISSFLTELELISDEEQIYKWKAILCGDTWSGWCTGHKIIYAIKKSL